MKKKRLREAGNAVGRAREEKSGNQVTVRVVWPSVEEVQWTYRKQKAQKGSAGVSVRRQERVRSSSPPRAISL